MIDEFLTFFFAGQETTANALAFSVMAIGRHPAVLEKFATFYTCLQWIII